MKVKDILTDESKWIKGQRYEYENGCIKRSCLVGAINTVCTSTADYINCCNEVREFLGIPGYESVSEWNDRPETTFADVRHLVEALDI